MTNLHDICNTRSHAQAEASARFYEGPAGAGVSDARGAPRSCQAQPARREALSDGFRRVGHDLLTSAQQVAVDRGWAAHTWPHRRYPQQCYPKTTRYVLEHMEIEGRHLVHGVVSHAPHFLPMDHAWVELPGDVVFDGVVQTFFTRGSYYAAMAAMAIDTYTSAETHDLVALHGHPGPWNASWVPTAAQLLAYAQAVVPSQAGGEESA